MFGLVVGTVVVSAAIAAVLLILFILFILILKAADPRR
jgi:uncharacterized membrane protein